MDKVMTRIKENYDKLVNEGYEVVGVFLQGSQNYCLEYEGSDIDCKAIILPKFEDFVLGKPQISTTLVLEDNSHIDLKDIRQMFLNIRKQNINFVEILFTKYKIMNPKYENLFRPMFDNKERMARYNIITTINSICGMCLEKYKALEHPYPATMEKIEKFGYDSKQLHHIIRLFEFEKRYIDGETYSDCLISKDKDYLIRIKKESFHTLEEARNIAKYHCDEIKKIAREYQSNNVFSIDKEMEDVMNGVITNIMRYNLKEELLR